MNNDFKKIINIGKQPEWSNTGKSEIPTSVFCKIEYKDKKLSITGVIGAMSNGNCRGACGQIYDSIEVNSFADGWNKSKLSKFVAIWKEWHLNDMNACTLDMKVEGWDKLASKKINKYSFARTDEAHDEFKALEKELIEDGKNKIIHPLSGRQHRLLDSERFIEVYAYEQPENPEFMELSIDYMTKKPKIEEKTLGWVSVNEHPDGLLSRELNGEKYGCKWYFHEVPSDVIEYLEALPTAKGRPVWI